MRNAPYNATGNGSTDDRAAIQRAIDAAREGEVVFPPPGTYVVGAQLRIVNKTTLPCATLALRKPESYACEVRECDLRNDLSWQNLGSDRSYALMIFSINSDHLIEDNIMFRNRYSMVFEGGGAGCVVAYNYSVGVLLLPDRNFGAYDLDTHGSHPFMNLFEGNVVTDSNYFVDVGLVPD